MAICRTGFGVGRVADGVLVGDPGEQLGLVGEERRPPGRVARRPRGEWVGQPEPARSQVQSS
jgi:hypothetical protein